jgi:hypothetical protein
MEKNVVVSWGGAAIRWWTNVVFPPHHSFAPSQDERAAAARFARGNIAIQAGLFITTKELEHQRKEVSKIVFPQ